MAKKRYKQSGYTRARNRILRMIRKIFKETGKKIDVSIPTEKQARKRGLSGTQLTKEVNKMKKLSYQDLKSFPSADEGKTGFTDGNINRFYNVMDYINRLAPTAYTKKRNPTVDYNAESYRRIIIASISQKVDIYGEEKIGKLLAENEEVFDYFVNAIYSDSKEESVQQAFEELMQVLDIQMDFDDLLDMADYAEQMLSYISPE